MTETVEMLIESLTESSNKTTTIFLIDYHDKHNITVAQVKGDLSAYNGYCVETGVCEKWKGNDLTKLLFSDNGATLKNPEIWENLIPSQIDPFDISKLSKSDYFIRVEWD